MINVTCPSETQKEKRGVRFMVLSVLFFKISILFLFNVHLFCLTFKSLLASMIELASYFQYHLEGRL